MDAAVRDGAFNGEGGLIMEQKNELIAQSNALTSSRYNFSPTEKNVIYHIIRKVRKDYVEGTMQRDLWNNMYVTIDSADLAKIADADHTERARKALRDLRHKDIEIEDENGNWLNVGFINYAKYKAKTKQYEIEVSKEIMPHLVELAKNFTSYSLTVAISLKSRYSQRFYELAHQYMRKNSGTFFLDFEVLRTMLKLGDGYNLKSNIQNKVIDVAVKELKELYDNGGCELWLESYNEGRGKSTRWFFKIHTREEAAKQQEAFEDLRKMSLYIYQANNRIFRKDPKFRERIQKAVEFEPKKIRPIFDKLTKLEKDVKVADLPALWRYILKNDFEIK